MQFLRILSNNMVKNNLENNMILNLQFLDQIIPAVLLNLTVPGSGVPLRFLDGCYLHAVAVRGRRLGGFN